LSDFTLTAPPLQVTARHGCVQVLLRATSNESAPATQILKVCTIGRKNNGASAGIHRCAAHSVTIQRFVRPPCDNSGDTRSHHQPAQEAQELPRTHHHSIGNPNIRTLPLSIADCGIRASVRKSSVPGEFLPTLYVGNAFSYRFDHTSTPRSSGLPYLSSGRPAHARSPNGK